MRKKIIVFLMLLALPVLVLGAFQPATLTNGVNRVAVFTSEQAQDLFSNGYTLEGTGKPVQKVCDCSNLGATPGNYFSDGLSVGGLVLATSTSGTAVTLLARDLMKYQVIDMTQNAGALTITLPASSALAGWLPSVGDSKEVFIRNATTTVQNITIAGGTGVTLKKQSGGALTIGGDASGDNYAVIKFIRMSKGYILANMLTFVD